MFKITVEGLDRDERREILDLINDAVREHGKYKMCGGHYPFEGVISDHTFEAIDTSNIYDDMSVAACAERFDARRQEILSRIRGGVSASMSGIDMCMHDFIDMGKHQDWMPVQVALTWNGEVHIERPEWRKEYDEWALRMISKEDQN